MRRWSCILACSALGLSAFGCKEKLEGPRPTLVELQPSLACAEAISQIQLAGADLSPMAVDSATGDPGLALPSITLQRTADRQGDPVSEAPITLEESRVGWTSAQSMSFTLDPALGLTPGVYKIKVTNPNGRSAELEPALDIVPPPSLSSVAPALVCVNVQPGAIRALDAGFLRIGSSGADDTLPLLTVGSQTFVARDLSGCAPLAGPTDAESCTGAEALVDGSLFTIGSLYDVVVTNPEPAACSSQPLVQAITAVPGPTVLFADPPIVWNGVNTPITVYAADVAIDVADVSILEVGSTATPTLLAFTPQVLHPERPDAVVPVGTTPGIYDLYFTDANGCPAILPSAFTVVETTALTLQTITPDFGVAGASTSVTITSDVATPFAPLPRGYLTNATLTAPVPLGSLALGAATTLSAQVPGLTAGDYDVVIVNGDGTVGVLPNGFHVVATLPLITSLNPAQVSTGQAAAAVDVNGLNFPAAPQVDLRCLQPDGVTFYPTQMAGIVSVAADLIQITVNTVTHTNGASCVVDVIDTATGARDTFSTLLSAPTNVNLTGFIEPTSPLLVLPRKGHAALPGQASRSARFIYTIGGDDGAAAHKTVENLSVDIFGKPGAAFTLERNELNTARTHIGAVRIGRFLYAVGGTTTAGATLGDPADALNTVERAAILDPDVVPVDLDVDVEITTTAGLMGGVYYYRVAGVMDAADEFNPGGETLPSAPFGLKLPSLSDGRLVTIELSWTAVPNAVGYRIYRTVADGALGTETLIADTTQTLTDVMCSGPTTCTDLGATPDGTNAPLPIGATGTWATLAQVMGAARMGPAVTFALDPMNANTAYLYAFGGQDATGALTSYEFLTIVIDPATGAQNTAAGFTAGNRALITKRARAGAYTLTSADTPFIPANTAFVWVGGGADEAGTVQTDWMSGSVLTASGQLGTTSATTLDSEGPTNGLFAGFGYFALGDTLYTLGGAGNAPSIDNLTTFLGGAATPPAFAGDQGFDPGLEVGRVDAAACVQSGWFYAIGGRTAAANATRSTEYILY